MFRPRVFGALRRGAALVNEVMLRSLFVVATVATPGLTNKAAARTNTTTTIAQEQQQRRKHRHHEVAASSSKQQTAAKFFRSAACLLQAFKSGYHRQTSGI